ncbi:MAG TPA: hypothetical protein VF546_18040 [Pyrinomonadaceae bacterium]|jgi:hypothetical protein
MTPQNDLEQTPAAPRFDAAETDTAQPVVPLAEVRAHSAGLWPRLRGATLRRSWPVALVVASLAAGVVGGMTGLVRQRQPAQESVTIQPAPTPDAVAPASQPARDDLDARPRAARVETTPRRARQPERPPVADATPDAAQVLALFGDARDDDDKRERKDKKKERKHRGRDDDDEDFKPRAKDAKRARARLFDVINDHDH